MDLNTLDPLAMPGGGHVTAAGCDLTLLLPQYPGTIQSTMEIEKQVTLGIFWIPLISINTYGVIL